MYITESGSVYELPFGDGIWTDGALTENGDYVWGLSILCDNIKPFHVIRSTDYIITGLILEDSVEPNIVISHPPFMNLKVDRTCTIKIEVDDEMDKPFDGYKRRLRLLKK